MATTQCVCMHVDKVKIDIQTKGKNGEEKSLQGLRVLHDCSDILEFPP